MRKRLLVLAMAIIGAVGLVGEARAVGPYLMISIIRCGDYRRGEANDMTDYEKKDCDDVMDGRVVDYITSEACGDYLVDETAATRLDNDQRAACKQWVQLVAAGEAGITGAPNKDGEYCQAGYTGVYTSDLQRKCEKHDYTYVQCKEFEKGVMTADQRDKCRGILASPTVNDCTDYANAIWPAGVAKGEKCYDILGEGEKKDLSSGVLADCAAQWARYQGQGLSFEEFTNQVPGCRGATQEEVENAAKGVGDSGKCTSILTFLEDSCKNDTDGKGITGILNVVLAILTAGVGVAATLGIVISGIQYMTARDNEDQAKKARKRIFEVVIGVAVYAVMWLALQWLLPGGVLGE